MYISQISVYLENVKGTLNKLTKLLSDNNIDILALAIADTSGFGIVRFIVHADVIDPCISLLQSAGYSARKNKVICVKVANEAGGLNKALTVLEDAGISVEYMYSFNYTEEGKALLIFRLSDRETGIEVLTANGIEVATQEEINAL